MDERGEFARARAKARLDAVVMRGRAARRVAAQAVDADDLRSLLSMLGLDDETDGASTFRRRLAGYVRAVSEAVGVPAEGSRLEVGDTATARLGLAQRWALRPGRHLMLEWTERHGWSVAVDSGPIERRPVVVDYLGGEDLVPTPQTVAWFVADVITGRRMSHAQPDFPVQTNRDELANRLIRYAGPG